MRSLKTKWQKTKIGEVVNVFSDQLRTILSTYKTEELQQLGPYLGRIFRRWYYTADAKIDKNSYSLLVKQMKRQEDWPQEGEFFITPALVKQGKSFVIQTKIDFIQDLDQMPLVADLKQGKPSLVEADYPAFFQEVKQILGKQQLEPTPVNIFKASKILASISWWEQSTTLNLAMACSFLEELYDDYLKRGLTDFVPVDDFFEDLLVEIRQKFPFMPSMKEIAKKDYPRPKTEEEKMGYFGFFLLSSQFDRWFLTPFTGWLLMIEPFYQDELTLKEEIEDFFEAPGFREVAFLKPCASVRLTSLGRKLVDMI